jgi:ABC-type spermidine/putrescine transport system permease subunit I
MPGVMAASVITFLFGVNSFLAPAVLGGAGQDLMSNIIVKRFLLDFNWPFGSALAIVLLVSMVLFLTIVSKYVALEDIYGTGR